jgi:hypothetical protein
MGEGERERVRVRIAEPAISARHAGTLSRGRGIVHEGAIDRFWWIYLDFAVPKP